MSDSVFILVLLPISLFIILFSLGIALTLDDFRRVANYPRGIAIGMANLLFISPLLAIGLALLFKLPPELAVGMVLLGASPGGTTANMLTHLAKGDTALSLTMTAISSITAVFTVPILLDLSTQWFMSGDVHYQVAMMPIVMKILLITLLPLGIGMVVRSRATQWSIRNEPRVKRFATVLFIVVVFAVLWAERESIFSNIASVGLAVLCLNLLAMAISYGSSKLAGLEGPQATAISIELGVHNTTLAMAVGAMVSAAMIIPAAVYSLFMYFTAGAFAKWMHSRNS